MKILIVTGGTSQEREISIKSAQFFQEFGPKNMEILYFPEDLERFLQIRHRFDLVIPVFHGKYGEDGMIFAFLKTLDLKTVFSDFETHALCLDKYRTNIFIKTLGVRCPKQILVTKNMNFDEKFLQKMIGFPCILKPNNGGSSFFTYKIANVAELMEKLNFVRQKTDEAMLICEYILWDEYSVSMVNRTVLPIMKLEKADKNAIFDYDAKYNNSVKIQETWPEIPKNLQKNLHNAAEKIWDFLNIRGFCRIDFIVRGDSIFFLEINTIPWMTQTSILPQSWEKTGKSFEDLVRVLIDWEK